MTLRRPVRTYGGTVFLTDPVLVEAIDGCQWLPPGEDGAEVLRKLMTD